MDRLPSAKIRDSLEQRIVEGELGNGKRLDETELSGFYGVSRTPVREALQRLAESGLAEHLPRRGTFVRAPSLSQLVEMFEVMAELECMAIRLAARRATAKDIDALEKDNETCRAAVAANDTKKYYEVNARLHGRIYQMSGNSFLAKDLKTQMAARQKLLFIKNQVLGLEEGFLVCSWSHFLLQIEGMRLFMVTKQNSILLVHQML